MLAIFNIVYNLSVGLSNARYSDAKKQEAELTDKEIPSIAIQNKITRILDRFQKLTLLDPIVPGEYGAGVKKGSRFPHEVWREPKIFAPIEVHWVPMVIAKWENKSDGELLEPVERMREDLYRVFPKNATVGAAGECPLSKDAPSLQANFCFSYAVAKHIKNWIQFVPHPFPLLPR